MKTLDIEKCNGLIANFMNETDLGVSYHIGYDNIMRVINKIEGLGYIVSNDRADTTILENKAFASAFVRVYGTRHKIEKSESLYRAVIDFLQHYNK